MNDSRYTFIPDENPLDHVVSNGGYASIFRTIACVGDSLASGEFETRDPDGTPHYYDLFSYSWGQFLARMTGATCHNFSRGGMTASEYCEGYAQDRGWWDPTLGAQAYILALGVNDLMGQRQPLGEMGDIHPTDPTQNQKTFTGYFARILQQYQAIRPDAHFFLVTMPHSVRYDGTHPDHPALADAHAARMYDLAAYFPNTYVIDLRRYAPPHDEAFAERFYLYGHLNALGYRLTAEQIATYMDWIIRRDPRTFATVGFIGNETPMLC